MKKAILNIKEQIQHLKEKNISFHVLDEEYAENYLQNYNYFFRLKAFLKNFDKDECGKYKNVDFVYLVKLYELDCDFKHLISKLIMNCEHLLKTHILNHCSNYTQQDGYDIVKNFLLSNNKVLIINLCKKEEKLNPYVKSLVERYFKNDAQNNYEIPMWVLLEILTFNELINFINFYCENNNSYKPNFLTLLTPIKHLRNCSAHNNCLLISFKNKIEIKENQKLKSNIKNKNIFSKKNKLKILRNQIINDFLCLILIIDEMSIQKSQFKKELLLFLKKCKDNSCYFKNNVYIKNHFIFIHKVILSFIKKW